MGLLDWFRRRRKKPPLERFFEQREKLEAEEKREEPKKPEETPSVDEIIEGARHRAKRREEKSKRPRGKRENQ